MRMKFAVAVALALVPSLASAQAPDFDDDQDNTRYGGSAAVFLTLPAEARGAALGGSISSLANDLSAVFYNPAGLPLMESGTQAQFSYMPSLADPRHLSGAIGWALRGGEFGLGISIEYVAMIVLGGIGTVWGAVAGAIAFVTLGKLMQTLGPNLPYIASLPTGLQTAVLFSLLVIVVLVVEPLGLFGLWLRIKRYFLAWPFRY